MDGIFNNRAPVLFSVGAMKLKLRACWMAHASIAAWRDHSRWRNAEICEWLRWTHSNHLVGDLGHCWIGGDFQRIASFKLVAEDAAIPPLPQGDGVSLPLKL